MAETEGLELGREYNEERPHSPLADRTPREFAEAARHFTPTGVS
jgi:transposase InsO family protein